MLRATRLYPHITGEHHPMADLESALVAPPLNLSSTTELQAEIETACRTPNGGRRPLPTSGPKKRTSYDLRTSGFGLGLSTGV